MSAPERSQPVARHDFAAASAAEGPERRTGQRRRKRPPPLSIRVTEAERERLKRDAAGGSVNGYIRRRLFGADAAPRRAKGKPPVDHAALGRVLGALGNSRLASNLNQIARAANMGALPVTPDLTEELTRACADIRAMRVALLNALGVKGE